MSNAAALASLHPAIRPLAVALLDRAPYELAITSAFRSVDEQDRLYAQGRTAPGPIVTSLRGGQSWHQARLAFDVAPIAEATGRPFWPNDPALWTAIGEAGESVGLRWGGRWLPPDLPHFEHRGGLSLEAALAGADPQIPPPLPGSGSGPGAPLGPPDGPGLASAVGSGSAWGAFVAAVLTLSAVSLLGRRRRRDLSPRRRAG